MITIFVFVGAMIGAPVRYLTDRAIQARHDSLFPWGTLTVNLVGCLVLGALGGVGAALPGAAIALIGTGFCGALTTYSTFSYETLRLIEQRAYFYAAMNVVISVVGGLGAALVAYTTASAMLG